MIRLDRDGDLWTVTLDRPAKANALTADMLTELIGVMTRAKAAKAVILTGNGAVFSAGADLAEARAGLATSPLWGELSSVIAGLPGLTVAALNGALAGGAFGMALACDVRIAVPGAKFFYPVMRLGFLPQQSDPARLVQLIGPARAKLILMGGAKITVDTALQYGLVDRIVPVEGLLVAAREIVADACGAEPAHIAAIKGMIAG